ncbi:G patch domain-containing protein 11 [Podila humilis]|nr:G patch domain-containing protein 11 [Podila humilis]
MFNRSNDEKEEEEEDYMSEAFLNSLVTANENQQNKNENLTYSQRRRQKEREHLANLPKSLKEREREAREKGLKTEIGEENKGMAMLLKMGFKKGETLGSQNMDVSTTTSAAATTTAIVTTESRSAPMSSPSSSLTETHSRSHAIRAPIAIQMKFGRGGLGMDTLKKQKEQEELEQQEKRTREIFDKDYRGSKMNQFELEKKNRQLGAAQSICMQLDVMKAAKERDAQAKTGTADTATKNESLVAWGNDKNKMELLFPRQGRSNSFWWIADSVPDDLVGTKMMGHAASPPSTATTIENPSKRHFDLSDNESGDLESRKEKRIRLSTPDLTDGDVLLDEQEPEAQWGERPVYAEWSLF